MRGAQCRIPADRHSSGLSERGGCRRSHCLGWYQRDELFITTKLTKSEQGYDKALRAFDESMNELGLDVLDLFLIHWPQPMFDQYVETWRAFERLLADGRVSSIGAVQNRGLLENPHILDVARRQGRTPGQVVLRWHI
ncbi:MAG TPA: aldo/keto reductase, partial [Propionibacteriaceae bacterium]